MRADTGAGARDLEGMGGKLRLSGSGGKINVREAFPEQKGVHKGRLFTHMSCGHGGMGGGASPGMAGERQRVCAEQHRCVDNRGAVALPRKA